jgi:hypothetical protein
MRLRFLLSLLLPALAQAGFERWEAGARPAAMGNAFVAVAEGPWAVVFNPAGLGQVRPVAIALSCSPQPFGVPELSTSTAAAAFPISAQGAIGAGFRRYGFALYRETSLSLAAAVAMRGIMLGLGMSYHAVSIQGYGAAGTLGLDAGLLVPIGSGWRWGACLKNFNAPTIGSSRERVPQCVSTGITCQPDSAFTLAFDMRKESRFPLAPRLGFEYRPVDAFAIRGGWTEESAEISGGVGLRWRGVEVDYAFVSHHELGGTHVASVTIAVR